MNSNRLKIKIALSALLIAGFSAWGYSANASDPVPASKTYPKNGLLEDRGHRSTDTHAIDVVPKDNPIKEEEETAEKQIKKSEENKEPKLPRGSGKVIAKPSERAAAVEEATAVGEHDKKVPDTVQEIKGQMHRPTIALALGGGGARGAAHIGVLRVFAQEGIPVDYIVGNSMGSIVGGLYAAGAPLEEITRVLENGSLLKAYYRWLPPKLLVSPVTKLLNPLRKEHYAGLYTGRSLAKWLEKNIPAGVENVQDTKIPFSAVALNLIDGKAYRISDGRLSTAIRASASISPLIAPVAIDDKVYMDGGIRANLPCAAARDTGADIVIAVLVDEPLRALPAANFKHLANIAGRMTDVVLAVGDEKQLQFADIVINPDVSGIPVLDKHAEDGEKAIKAGELAARKALPIIRKKLGLPPKNSTVSDSSLNSATNSGDQPSTEVHATRSSTTETTSTSTSKMMTSE